MLSIRTTKASAWADNVSVRNFFHWPLWSHSTLHFFAHFNLGMVWKMSGKTEWKPCWKQHSRTTHTHTHTDKRGEELKWFWNNNKKINGLCVLDARYSWCKVKRSRDHLCFLLHRYKLSPKLYSVSLRSFIFVKNPSIFARFLSRTPWAMHHVTLLRFYLHTQKNDSCRSFFLNQWLKKML